MCGTILRVQNVVPLLIRSRMASLLVSGSHHEMFKVDALVVNADFSNNAFIQIERKFAALLIMLNDHVNLVIPLFGLPEFNFTA